MGAIGLQPEVKLFQKQLAYLFFLSSVEKERHQQTSAQQRHCYMLNLSFCQGRKMIELEPTFYF